MEHWSKMGEKSYCISVYLIYFLFSVTRKLCMVNNNNVNKLKFIKRHEFYVTATRLEPIECSFSS